MSARDILSVEGLTMRFGGIVAVNDLSFTAQRQKITALIDRETSRVAFVVSTAWTLLAQSPEANLSGIVSDAQGAVIAGAQVTQMQSKLFAFTSAKSVRCPTVRWIAGCR